MSKRPLVSVICPSRLQLDVREKGSLLVEKAISSVRKQSAWSTHDCELILALGPEIEVPSSSFLRGVQVVRGERPGQAAAMNAGVKASRGDMIAFIEDDDTWNPLKIAVQLQALTRASKLRRRQFASSSQMEVDMEGKRVQVNDFATPSGWLMGRDIWDLVGPLNESFRWHLDSEWLARLNAAGVSRVHLIDDSRPVRDLILVMARYSHIENTGLILPLVTRLINPEGGMSRINSDKDCARQSRSEYNKIRSAFGEIPW